MLANGFSGAGKAPKAHLMASEGLGAASPYGVGGVHRHVPEIMQNLRLAGADEVTISFTPTLVPMARGILATTTARLAPGVDIAAVRAAYDAVYADETFIHLLPEGQWPTTAATLGANTAQIQVAIDARANRLVAVSAIDNLVKGTAGGAIQSMNLALGLDETTGLSHDRSRAMSVTAAKGFTAAGVAGRSQVDRRARRRRRRQRRPVARRRRGVHQQPVQGQPGALERRGHQVRLGRRRRHQLRWRQLLHRPRGIRDDASHRRDRRRRRSASARSTYRSARPG